MVFSEHIGLSWEYNSTSAPVITYNKSLPPILNIIIKSLLLAVSNKIFLNIKGHE